MQKFIIRSLAVLALGLGLAACERDAQVASRNLSYDADNFRIPRRIVFYNGITDTYMLEIKGYCSQEPKDKKLEVTCKLADGTYKEHFLGLSDNVTYFSEQLSGAQVSTSFYSVSFKPSVIIPAIELR